MRQIHHKLLVAIVGIRDILGIVAFPAIAVGIVTGDLPCGILQHIAVAVELIALEGLGCVIFFAGEHEAPGDTVALVEQYHLRVGELCHGEHGVIVLGIAREIGEECVCGQLQHNLVTIDVEVVGSLLHIDIGHEVLTVVGVVLREDAGASIHIHCATLTRIIGIATLGREGDAIVIDTPVSLVARSSAPPVATVGSGLTATHVSLLGVVDTPGTGDTVDIRCEVYLRVLKRKLFGDRGLAEAVAVAKTQFHVVGAGLVVGPVHGVQGRVDVAVDSPYGVGLCWHISHSEGGLVHTLVHIHVDIHIRDGGDAILIRTVEGLRRAGCEKEAGDSSQETVE